MMASKIRGHRIWGDIDILVVAVRRLPTYLRVSIADVLFFISIRLMTD